MDAKRLSILSAIAASSCCVPPLILLGLILLGVGTAGVAGLSSTLGSLKWYILPLAIAGLGLSYYLYFREKRKCSNAACQMTNKKLTNTILTISTLVVVGFTGWSVYPYVLGESLSPTEVGASSARFAVFQIEGMTCGGCEIAVNGAIESAEVVDSVKSSFTDGKAYVWYDGQEESLRKISKAIASVGYKAKLIEKSEVTK